MEWLKRIVNTLTKNAFQQWRSFFVRSVIILGSILLISLSTILYIYSTPYNTSHKDFIINRGKKRWESLALLHEEGILPHPLISIIGSVFFNGSLKIIAGEYRFEADMSPQEVLRMLELGKVIEHKITFPEGWSVYEIINLINNDCRLAGSIIHEISEGSLFPSTYNIQRNYDRSRLVKLMTDQMAMIASELMKSNQNPFIKTPHQLIIFASILEKEAATPNELPRIAGVFVNRLKKNMRLQSCPTAIYAQTLGKQKFSRVLTYKDLKVDSKYNTYVRDGLPIGPICCPGLNALEAAAHPLETNELFFVFNGKKHYFSVTYKEHLENKRRIRNAIRTLDE